MTAFKQTGRGIGSPNNPKLQTETGGPKAALIGVPVVLLVVGVLVALLWVKFRRTKLTD